MQRAPHRAPTVRVPSVNGALERSSFGLMPTFAFNFLNLPM